MKEGPQGFGLSLEHLMETRDRTLINSVNAAAQAGFARENGAVERRFLVHSDFRFEPERLTLTGRNGMARIPKIEANILETFFKNIRQVSSYDEIFKNIWGEAGRYYKPTNLSPHVFRLKKRLSQIGIDDPDKIIINILGEGFLFEDVNRPYEEVDMNLEIPLIEVYNHPDFKFIPGRREVIVNGEEVGLHEKEFLILETLVRNENRHVLKSYLRDEVWGDEDIDGSSIPVHVSNLRSKLWPNDKSRGLKMLRGGSNRGGYMLTNPDTLPDDLKDDTSKRKS